MRYAKRISALALLPALLFAFSGCGENNKVTVPNVGNRDAARAYELLHKAGFEVSLSQPLSYRHSAFLRPPYPSQPDPDTSFGIIAAQTPRAGSVVSRGSSVPLRVGGDEIGQRVAFQCPSTPDKAPDLIGATLSQAADKAGRCLSLAIRRLPRLDRAEKSHLYDNWVVTRQSPAAGAVFLPLVSASNPPGPRTISIQVALIK
jgi:hypothetical protein